MKHQTSDKKKSKKARRKKQKQAKTLDESDNQIAEKPPGEELESEEIQVDAVLLSA